MTARDPAAELLDALTVTPAEQAERDAALVGMRRDADAAFAEVARNRAADDALLMQVARDGADALEEMLRQSSSITPLTGRVSVSWGARPSKPRYYEVGRRPEVFEGGGSGTPPVC